MTPTGILQIAIFLALILVCAKPLGAYMARVFNGERTFLHPVLRWLEVLTYKVTGIREDVEQRWTHYTASLLSFSIFGFLIVYLLQRVQCVHNACVCVGEVKLVLPVVLKKKVVSLLEKLLVNGLRRRLQGQGKAAPDEHGCTVANEAGNCSVRQVLQLEFA